MRTAAMTRPKVEDYEAAADEVVATTSSSTAATSEPSASTKALPIGQQLYENLSGTAGTGKTTMARALIDSTPAGSVVLAATTGIAAVNLGEGTTINALLRYFDTASLHDAYLRGLLQTQVRRLRRTGVHRILLDEKSMLSGQQLTLIARAVREVNEGRISALEAVGAGEDFDAPQRDDELPPIGLTLVGDFGQLPPVPDTDQRTGKKIPIQFAFDSPEWPAFAQHTTTLTRIWRQDAQAFVQALHAVRRADVRTALEFFTADRFVDAMDPRFTGTTIFAKNDEVERWNQLRLDELPGALLTFDAARVGKQRGDWKQVPDRLVLKEGALVMILANRRQSNSDEDEQGRLIYANGDLGVLEGKASDTYGGWYVRLHRTGQQVKVYPVVRQHTIPLEPGRRKELREHFGECWTEHVTEDGKGKHEIIGTVLYMPLRAAYGATVHKTQGLTLDQVQVNIRDPFWRQPGMLFVALSRARTPEGLRLIGNQTGFVERCRIEPRVLPWL